MYLNSFKTIILLESIADMGFQLHKYITAHKLCYVFAIHENLVI